MDQDLRWVFGIESRIFQVLGIVDYQSVWYGAADFAGTGSEIPAQSD